MEQQNPNRDERQRQDDQQDPSLTDLQRELELFRRQQFSPQQIQRHQQELADARSELETYRRQYLRAIRDAVGILPSSNDGLTPGRIERFEHFRADESLVGEQCLVCMKDLENGTQMVRLDCHVNHYLCKMCANTWFKDNKTCPNCRHEFN